jgi:hypothetical protein
VEKMKNSVCFVFATILFVAQTKWFVQNRDRLFATSFDSNHRLAAVIVQDLDLPHRPLDPVGLGRDPVSLAIEPRRDPGLAIETRQDTGLAITLASLGQDPHLAIEPPAPTSLDRVADVACVKFKSIDATIDGTWTISILCNAVVTCDFEIHRIISFVNVRAEKSPSRFVSLWHIGAKLK